MNPGMGGHLRPAHLRTERRIAPLGIDQTQPWLSWTLQGSATTPYSGFQLQTSAQPDFRTLTWDSSHQAGPAVGCPYGGPPLGSRSQVYWRVRAFAAPDDPGPWSETAHFDMGLLLPEDWTAAWIGIDEDRIGTPVHLSTRFEVPDHSVRGRLYVGALGWVRVFVDSEDLTQDTLVPRFTPYDDEVEYLTFNLDRLTPGAHSLSLIVGDGRFRGALGLHGVRGVYGDRIGAIAQAEFHLPDGTIQRVGSDAGWAGGHGVRTFADPKDGETIDLTLSAHGSDHAISTPSTVVELPAHPRRLVAEQTEPVRAVARLAPSRIDRRVDGSVLVDFGQNIAGVVRLRVRDERGRRLTLQHAEDLDASGELEWAHLDREGRKRDDRPWRFQRDEIILDGGTRWVQPWFTLHGFRYVEITGLAEELAPADIEAVVLSSVEVDAGSFSCSDGRLNQLFSNAAWSMTGNFLDTPTDCPTRERGGFTGDAQVFAPTATMLAEVTGFFGRYLRSLEIDQLEDGRIPMIIPREYSPFSGPPQGATLTTAGSIGWGDAAVLLPWTIYQATGDSEILRRQYGSMAAWVDYLRRTGARRGYIWGEWLRAGEHWLLGSIRDNSINRKNIGLAYLAHSASLVARIAAILGEEEESARHETVAADALTAWRRAAVRRGGARIGSDRQDDYVRALAFGLLTPPQRERAGARLAHLIERRDRIGTGFLSTALLLPTLEEIGRPDLAYRLLLRQDAPSWLGQVAAGATTIWENWEEPGKDGRRVGSSNHYAFGSVASWLISGVVGLTSDQPGRGRVTFAPRPGGGLSMASASLATPYGPVEARWAHEAGELVVTLDLPPGVEGRILAPGGRAEYARGRQEARWRWE